MADKKLNQVSQLTDFDYALVVKGNDVAKVTKQQLATILGGTFYIHAGPEDLTHIGWGAAGCVEIIGSFSEFKDQVKELSGSTQVDADSAISELVFYKKLYIEIEYATPPNIKANFYKEVSIKRR